MHVRPYYILFSGVNGAGKSTLFHTRMWLGAHASETMGRVNPDEILREHGWDWHDRRAQIRAGKEAVRLIRGYFDARDSFNQETTLTGKSALRNVSTAHELGYRVIVYYVGVADPRIANDRIAHRVSIGGHFIDPETVQRRFRASLDNLIQAVGIADEAYLYDNTRQLELEARFVQGELAYVNPVKPELTWIDELLAARGYEQVSL